jgi:hypothetical protein
MDSFTRLDQRMRVSVVANEVLSLVHLAGGLQRSSGSQHFTEKPRSHHKIPRTVPAIDQAGLSPGTFDK